VFSAVLQDRHSTGPGNHQIDDRADWGILALGDGSVTCLGKLGLEACLFEMIGNNSLDGIIRLDQQNSIIPLRNAHDLNWTRTWLMVNRKFFCQLNFYHFDNHSNLMPIIRRNALQFQKTLGAIHQKISLADGQRVILALGTHLFSGRHCVALSRPLVLA
jgi:hypothetical protein